MRVFTTICLLLLCSGLMAQLPRNTAGRFEYDHIITVTNATASQLEERALRFLRKPFMIRWDTTATPLQVNNNRVVIVGLMNIRGIRGHMTNRRAIPVLLPLTLTIKEGVYQYTLRQLAFKKTDQWSHSLLEQRPKGMNAQLYEEVLNRVHENVLLVVSQLKRAMEGEKR